MTPVYQDRFGKGNGNCMQAAIASILDAPLDTIPAFEDAEDKWFEAIAGWAVSAGVSVLHMPASGERGFIAIAAYGVGIWSVDGTEERHAVVMRFDASPTGRDTWWTNADVVHDPNPKQMPLREWEEVLFFIPANIR